MRYPAAFYTVALTYEDGACGALLAFAIREQSCTTGTARSLWVGGLFIGQACMVLSVAVHYQEQETSKKADIVVESITQPQTLSGECPWTMLTCFQDLFNRRQPSSRVVTLH